MKEFTQEDLQQVLAIHTDEVARSFRIAKGIDAVRRLYNARGYVNFTCVPDTKFDDDAHTIAVSIDLDEGKQFRFGDLTLPGLNEHSRQNVLQRWDGIRGSVYSREREETFFRSVMKPPDRWARQHPNFTYSSLLHRSLDERAGTVNLSINFIPQSDKVR